MTKDDFEQYYCKQTGMTLDEFESECDILPCDCGHEFCYGWVVIDKN